MSLSQLCDSLVFSVMGKEGSRRVYYDEKDHSELIDAKPEIRYLVVILKEPGIKFFPGVDIEQIGQREQITGGQDC